MTDDDSDDGISRDMKALLLLGGILIVLLGAIFMGQTTPAAVFFDNDTDRGTEDPLTEMAADFEGIDSRFEIRVDVDASLANFDIRVNDFNREKVGNLTVNLADGSDKTEMEIIRCVRREGPLKDDVYEGTTKWENYKTVARGCVSNE